MSKDTLSKELPEDIREFLHRLDIHYADVFMTMWSSPCQSCNQGQPRLVHTSPVCFELGEALKKLQNRYKF